jgi:hypothetical protein
MASRQTLLCGPLGAQRDDGRRPRSLVLSAGFQFPRDAQACDPAAQRLQVVVQCARQLQRPFRSRERLREPTGRFVQEDVAGKEREHRGAVAGALGGMKPVVDHLACFAHVAQQLEGVRLQRVERAGVRRALALAHGGQRFLHQPAGEHGARALLRLPFPDGVFRLRAQLLWKLDPQLVGQPYLSAYVQLLEGAAQGGVQVVAPQRVELGGIGVQPQVVVDELRTFRYAAAAGVVPHRGLVDLPELVAQGGTQVGEHDAANGRLVPERARFPVRVHEPRLALELPEEFRGVPAVRDGEPAGRRRARSG